MDQQRLLSSLMDVRSILKEQGTAASVQNCCERMIKFLQQHKDNNSAPTADFYGNVNVRVIIVEGLDGVGKSTTASTIAMKLNGQCLQTPPPELQSIRHFFDGKDESTRRGYYHLGNFMLAEQIADLAVGASQDQPLNIVIDRWWPSTVVYSLAYSFEHVDKEKVAAQLQWPVFLPKPPFYMIAVLRVDENERRQRLRKRSEATGQNKTIEEHKLEKEFAFRDSVGRLYARVHQAMTIETAQRGIDEVAERVIEMMKEKLKGGN